MERYDSYKDSGVKWLGEIPSHWEMKRWRFLMDENTAKNTNCNVRLQLQFKYGDIVQKPNQSEEKDALETISKYTVVEPDDIMINGLNLNYDFVSQRVARVREQGAITSAYVSLRPTDIANSRYYTYFLKSMDAKKMFHGMGTGIRLTLSYNELKNRFLPQPSLIEQEAIANYLDSTTSKIDEAIAQQQKMIDLLNERKQIIINNAVTKGLDPNVKMKPSGIDWIGDIPEHWEVSRFKSCSFVKANLVHPQNYLSYQQISPECIEKNSGRLIGNKTVADAGVISDNHYFKKGQILYSKIRPALNKAIIAPFDGLCSADMYPIETINHPNFMLYVVLSHYFSGQVQLVVNDRVKMPKINKEELGEIVVTYPPKIVEQGMISSYIERELDKIQSVILKYNKQISLLQERKQIIINDVVTGKVKVV